MLLHPQECDGRILSLPDVLITQDFPLPDSSVFNSGSSASLLSATREPGSPQSDVINDAHDIIIVQSASSSGSKVSLSSVSTSSCTVIAQSHRASFAMKVHMFASVVSDLMFLRDTIHHFFYLLFCACVSTTCLCVHIVGTVTLSQQYIRRCS